jgi:hypothetical protein
MEYKGQRFHPQCFKCAACDQRIAEPRFREHEGRRYHDHCYTVQCASPRPWPCSLALTAALFAHFPTPQANEVQTRYMKKTPS